MCVPLALSLWLSGCVLLGFCSALPFPSGRCSVRALLRSPASAQPSPSPPGPAQSARCSGLRLLLSPPLPLRALLSPLAAQLSGFCSALPFPPVPCSVRSLLCSPSSAQPSPSPPGAAQSARCSVFRLLLSPPLPLRALLSPGAAQVSGFCSALPFPLGPCSAGFC